MFWASTGLFILVDYVGLLFGLGWPMAPDLFPNAVLGVPLALCQSLSVIFLAIAAATAAAQRRPPSRRVALFSYFAVAAFFGLVNFAFYCFTAVLYQVHIAGRGL